MEHAVCRLCNRPGKHHPKKFRLYGVPVCRRCYYGFANRRQLGYVIDALLWFPVSYGLGTAAGHVMIAAGVRSQKVLETATFALGWLVFPLLFICKDGFAGRSPGKAICGVCVVDRGTFEPGRFLASFKRNLILMVPLMPLIVAVLLQRGYRLGDGWARSKVIWKRYAGHPLFRGALACERCGYDLRGSASGACPECGAPVPIAQG